MRFCDERDDVLVVPQEERSLGHLEVRAAYASGDLLEERRHDLLELARLDHLEDLLRLVEEEHLLGGVGHRPEGEDGLDDLDGELRVLLYELRHAVRELLVVEVDVPHLVQRQQRLHQELLVLLLEGQREAVDDGAEDLEQLGDTVVSLGLVDEAVEDVVDGLADEGAIRHELAVDSMEDGLEIVPLSRVLRVEEVEQPDEELCVDVLLDHLGVRLVRDQIGRAHV